MTSSEDTSALSTPPFEYHPSLQEYTISERDYLQANPQFQGLCTGIVVFNKEGKLLLVQRARTEKAFPELWEIPGGKVDEPDETMLHGAVRELKEEAGLEATRIVRKVGEFSFVIARRNGKEHRWIKHIFEMEVKNLDAIVLDPVEHQDYLFATEEDVVKNKAGDVELKYITSDNKFMKLEAFRHQREAASSRVGGVGSVGTM